MPTITQAFGELRIPRPTPEQQAEAEAYFERERQRVHRERVERARIPERYRGATLDGMPGLKAWASAFGARKCEKPETSLLLSGCPGSGKTWAACAILNEVVDVCPVRFASVPDVLGDLHASWDGMSREADVFAKYEGVRLLVLDDLGKGKPTATSVEALFRIVDERYRQARPTVYTTQYGSDELVRRLTVKGDSETAKAIVSRLSECVRIDAGNVDRRRHG